jgi:hypothetical protein
VSIPVGARDEAPHGEQRPTRCATRFLPEQKTLLFLAEGKRRRQRQVSRERDGEARRSSVEEKRATWPIRGYAAGRRENPEAWAKEAGRPWSVTVRS